MFFDTKSVLPRTLIATMLALVSTPVIAQSAFPFEVTRDAKGTLTRIDLPVRTSLMSVDEDILGELRADVAAYQTQSLVAQDASAPIPDSADDRKVYAQAKAFLKKDFNAATLADNRLDREFAKAKAKILSVKLYRLLAAPTKASAFDQEQILTQAIQEILGQAGDLLGLASPAFSVFEFIVDQYVDSLESRREFYQNQLIVLLSNDSSQFTAKEKSAVLSSIFYSRLAFYNLPARKKAEKAWATYGDDQLTKELKPCKGYVGANDKAWGACFKQDGDKVMNRMVSKVALSKSPSLAFDAKNPGKVGDQRRLLLLARLGVKLLPIPGLAKEPLNYWLDSQYKDQRNSEGYFFAYTQLRSQTDLSNWILDNSVNPIIRK